jgi:succinyl-CoA synthetase alpha subunit
VSTCVSMGGDYATGLRMVDYLDLFEADAETDAVVIFGEPGTTNEQDVAAGIAQGRLRKPIIALVVGAFQERYPPGVSFGHAAAMIASDADTASAKRAALASAGAHVVDRLEAIPGRITSALAAASSPAMGVTSPERRVPSR